ncbi:hypothetical protein FMM05_10955 [Flavobacterium zepuense]|uniref:Lipoprotein n=1 Tax=Flavobacterium zepuense TaxID=2593302 RepID=A0A552V1L7_9FLAO|nr:hypothetical protein [Flavobacterium zepuense]TRW24342.1 hypothetical protein FMM05_10955 [Flavobacterium zepuense]
MKKQILKFGILVTLLASFVSCSDNDEIMTTSTSSNVSTDNVSMTAKMSSTTRDQILKDKDFNNFVTETYDFNEKILDHKAYNQIYNTIKSTGKITPQQEIDITKALGLNSFSQYTTYLNTQALRVANLEKNYGFQSQLTNEERIEVIEITLDNHIPITTNGGCAQQLRGCRRAASAWMASAHVACLMADLSVVGGIICHGAALYLGDSLNEQCLGDYAACIK